MSVTRAAETVSLARSARGSTRAGVQGHHGVGVDGLDGGVADPDAVDAAANSFRGIPTPGNIWFDRWLRTGLLDGSTFKAVDPEGFGRLLEAVSNLPARPGAVEATGPSDTDIAIGALLASGIGFAVTGEAAFGNRFVSSPTFYAADPAAAAEVLESPDAVDRTTITLIPLPVGIETESVNGVRYVSAERALVDLYGTPVGGPETAARFLETVTSGLAPEMRLRLFDRAIAIAGVGYSSPDPRQLGRSIALHRMVGRKLVADPDAAIGSALSLLPLVRAHASGGALQYADEWERLLTARDIHGILGVFADRTSYGSDMRTMSPFAGVLSENEYLESLGVGNPGVRTVPFPVLF